MKLYLVFICAVLGALQAYAEKYPGHDSSTAYSLAGKKNNPARKAGVDYSYREGDR
jgi:hypothetical protein